MSDRSPLDAPDRPRLTIDLDALARNYARARRAAGSAEVGATIKADAYGLGVGPVGSRLLAEGCRRFFVANADEAAGLRAHLGADAAIYVYNGYLAGEARVFAEHDLRPVLNDPGQVERWIAEAQGAPSALHVDTGMNRLGMSAAEFERLGNDGSGLARAGVELVMSHLACADEPDHPLNAIQLQRFAAIAGRARVLRPGVTLSLSNSAGLYLDPAFRFDVVRPGIALYGASPMSAPPHPAIEAVATLEAPILQIREADAGESVGYGAATKLEAPRRLATVALGYADGFLRSGSGRGYGVLAGVKAPIMGRISMDLITIDATDAGEAAKVGALVEFLGPNARLEDAASAAGTIPYELLTCLGERYARRHFGTPQ